MWTETRNTVLQQLPRSLVQHAMVDIAAHTYDDHCNLERPKGSTPKRTGEPTRKVKDTTEEVNQPASDSSKPKQRLGSKKNADNTAEVNKSPSLLNRNDPLLKNLLSSNHRPDPSNRLLWKMMMSYQVDKRRIPR